MKKIGIALAVVLAIGCAAEVRKQEPMATAATEQPTKAEPTKKEEKAESNKWTKASKPTWATEFAKEEKQWAEAMETELKTGLVIAYEIDLAKTGKATTPTVWVSVAELKKLEKLERRERLQPVCLGLEIKNDWFSADRPRPPRVVYVKDSESKKLLLKWNGEGRFFEGN